MKNETFLTLFLKQNDLGTMQEVVAQRRIEMVTDPSLKAYGATYIGRRIWRAQETTLFFQVIDVRWGFAEERGAKAFHRERLGANTERQPRIPGMPLVGHGCVTHGGAVEIVPGRPVTGVCYLFRVGKVLAKVFAMQSPQLRPDTIELAGALAPLAVRAEAILRETLASSRAS